MDEARKQSPHTFTPPHPHCQSDKRTLVFLVPKDAPEVILLLTLLMQLWRVRILMTMMNTMTSMTMMTLVILMILMILMTPMDDPDGYDDKSYLRERTYIVI